MKVFQPEDVYNSDVRTLSYDQTNPVILTVPLCPECAERRRHVVACGLNRLALCPVCLNTLIDAGVFNTDTGVR